MSDDTRDDKDGKRDAVAPDGGVTDTPDGPAPSQDVGVASPAALDTVTPDMIDSQALSDMQAFKSLEESRKKKKRKRIVKIIVAIVVVLLLICGIATWFIAKSVNDAMQQMTVQTDTVKRGTYTAQVNATGTLDPISSVSVTPEIDGIVSEVYVAEGDTVTAGQTLFTVTNDSLDQSITAAEQSVKAASNSVDQAYASYASAVDSYNSAVDAYNRSVAAGDAGAVLDLASLQNAIDSAQIGIDSAGISLETAQKELESARQQGDKRIVTAPISGSVLQMGAQPGIALSSLSSSQKVPCQIADISSMSMTLQINEVDIAQVAVGQKASISFDSLPDLTIDATVTRIASTSTSQQGAANATGGSVVTYGVDLLLNTGDARLKPGMSASASITTDTLEDVLMVPETSVQTADDGSKYVIVQAADFDKTGATTNVPVTVTTQNGATAVIEGAVKEGDVIQMTVTPDLTQLSQGGTAAVPVG